MPVEPVMSDSRELSAEPVSMSPPRFDVVDIVKGIAITLVVMGHTMQGMGHRGWWETPFSRGVDSFIYSFHMPAFFLVSGLFIEGSLRKRGAKAFIAEKTGTILYPYLLWTIISAAFSHVLVGIESGGPKSLSQNVIDIFTGNASWFLYTLYCMSLLAVLLIRLPAWLRVALSLCIAVALPASGFVVTDAVFGELPFFLIGIWLGKEVLLFVQSIPKYVALLGSAMLFVYQGICIVQAIQPHTEPTTRFLGLTGAAALFLGSFFLDGSAFGRACAWVGRASLGVFLMHPFVQGATREVLVRVFHTRNVAAHLIVTTLVATLVPTLIWSLKDRLHYGWLFSMPKRKPVPSASIQG